MEARVAGIYPPTLPLLMAPEAIVKAVTYS